jgi:type II secretory pathway pseudopilin PulG
MKIYHQVTGDKWRVTGTKNLVTRHSSLVTGFTLVEIAISLAVIGIALVAIIAVLPQGLNVQRENRERTVVNQDATIFIEAIRNGARGADDLTNYVYRVEVGNQVYPAPFNSGAQIIGLLTTPGFTNHANVRSISGPAGEKPPQDNNIVVGDSFAYRIVCENVPAAVYTPPLWQDGAYNVDDYVSYLLNGQTTYWRAVATGQPSSPPQSGDRPTFSNKWVRNLYPQELSANLHELRLTFLWPILPNGLLPARPARQTFRTLIAGKIIQTLDTSVSPNQTNYFFQSQSFVNAP